MDADSDKYGKILLLILGQLMSEEEKLVCDYSTSETEKSAKVSRHYATSTQLLFVIGGLSLLTFIMPLEVGSGYIRRNIIRELLTYIVFGFCTFYLFARIIEERPKSFFYSLLLGFFSVICVFCIWHQVRLIITEWTFGNKLQPPRLIPYWPSYLFATSLVGLFLSRWRQVKKGFYPPDLDSEAP